MPRHLKKTILILLSAYLFLSSLSVSATALNPACQSDVKGYCTYSTAKKQSLENQRKNSLELAAEAESFVVPGIEFLNIQGDASLGNVLIRLYTYLLALVGISALLMFVWGGLKYTMATEGGAKEARQKITNAALGLGIALLAYLGLLTINPDFLKKLDIEAVLKPITSIKGSQNSLENTEEGGGCFYAGLCGGVVKIASNGKKVCEPVEECEKTENANVCIGTIRCADGRDVSFHNTKFRSKKACEQGCTPRSDICGTKDEEFEILSIQCGTN